MNAVVSEKGQVTIPKALRDRLGISAGTRLEFHDEDGTLVARKVVERDPVDRAWGLLRNRGNSDDVIARLRDRR